MFAQFESCDRTRIRKWVNRIEQRVSHIVVIGCKLSFNSRYRKEPSNANIQTLFDGKVQICVLEHRVEPVHVILLQQLLTKIPFRGCKPVVDAIEPRKVKTPIKLVLLDHILYALHIYDSVS